MTTSNTSEDDDDPMEGLGFVFKKNKKNEPAEETAIIAAPKLAELPRSPTADIIADTYQVVYDHPLSEYSTVFGNAYAVRGTKQAVDDKYCLVLHNNLPVRMPVILALRDLNDPSFISPAAAEIVANSHNDHHQVMIVLPRPQGITLADFCRKNGPCSELFITDNVIVPLVRSLRNLHDAGLCHGSIHPNNIYITHEKNVIIGECISKTAGFSQPAIYEPMERMFVSDICKGEGESATDLYALGVLSAYLATGGNLLGVLDDDYVRQVRSSKGTFNALFTDYPLTPSMRDLLKGLLHDKKTERWKDRHVLEWAKGKKVNISNSSGVQQASRFIAFNDTNHANCKSLSYDLARNWDKAARFLKDNRLIRWLERSVDDLSISERMEHIVKMSGNFRGTTSLDEDEFISRALLILNPEGPFHSREMAIMPEGIGATLAFGYGKNRKEYLQTIAKLIYNGTVSILTETKQETRRQEAFQIIWLLERLKNYVDKNEFGFGLERCLYELNPDLPCQSPLLVHTYTASVGELLENLEKVVREKDSLTMDRHIAAYISTKLGLTSSIRIRSLGTYPVFEQHRAIRALALLSFAQKESRIKQLPAITTSIRKQLSTYTSLFCGKTTRAEIEEKLLKVEKDGNLSSLFNVISDSNFVKRDRTGFLQASAQYHMLEKQVQVSADRKRVYDSGYNYGLKFCMIASYILCTVVTLTLISRAI